MAETPLQISPQKALSHGALEKSCLVANALGQDEIHYRAPRPVTSEDSLKCRNKNEEKKKKNAKKEEEKKERKKKRKKKSSHY